MTFEIITPGRFIESKDSIPMSCEMEGIFTLSAVKNGSVVRSHSFTECGVPAEINNLVLNQGLDRFGEGQGRNIYETVHLGVGTTAPQVTDTQLASRVGEITTRQNTSVSPGREPDWYVSLNQTWLSAVGAMGNNNLTEIGVGGSATQLFSRALILDSLGNPTSFPISSDEQLLVSYEIRMYPPLEDFQYEVDVDGTRECTVRATGVNALPSGNAPGWTFVTGAAINANMRNIGIYTGGLVPITGTVPSGFLASSGAGVSVSTNDYAPGTYKRSGRVSYTSGAFNSSQARTHVVGPTFGTFQVMYDPPLSKNSEQTMFLEYEWSWSRR